MLFSKILDFVYDTVLRPVIKLQFWRPGGDPFVDIYLRSTLIQSGRTYSIFI